MTDITIGDCYSQVADLLVGDVFVDESIKERHVIDATNEVDSRLGFAYTTPFSSGNLSRAGWLLIKRISNFIASGRLLLEIDQAGEQQMIHAYGKSLLTQVDETIAMIINGNINLLPENPPVEPQVPNAVHVMNVDPYSAVEAFYGWAAAPPTASRFLGGH